MKEHPLQLQFCGQKVTLRSQGDADIVQEALQIANLKLRDVEKRVKKVAPHHVALIALLEMAEEYVKSKRQVSRFKKEVTNKVEKVVSLLEHVRI